jgi:hypothetical protein
MLTADYTNIVSLDGILILISIFLDNVKNRIFGRETY